MHPFVPEGKYMNSRGCEPTVSATHYTHHRGFHTRLFVFGRFTASFVGQQETPGGQSEPAEPVRLLPIRWKNLLCICYPSPEKEGSIAFEPAVSRNH